MNAHKLLYLSGQDVIDLGAFNVKDALNDVE